MHEKYYIGCSGYYYPFWKNRFYPAGTQPKDWLKFYSSIFNTVELNGTFYKIPKLSDLKKYALTTPANFKFSVKMNKYITHNIKLKQSEEEIFNFQSLIREGLGTKLNYFLFQLPPSFHYNEENLERIITNIPHKQESVIELRHASWWNSTVENVFRKAKLTFCNIDFPGLKTKFIHTTDVFYLRLHGNPELFRSPYSIDELNNFYKNFPAHSKQYTIYFNNTDGEAAYKNAVELMKITKSNA
jgi:uncharacterized protein YecE (DUF72 family)